MIDGQTNIFEMLYPTYKITKKIRTIELFGDYGSQLLSLKYINADVEQWKLCEWAVKSIQAYKDIHFEEDTKDYSKDLEIGQIKEFLFNKGISSNYNEPMSMAQPNSETRRGRVQKEAIQTLTTQNNLGVCVGTYQYSKSDNFMKGKDRLQLGKEVSDTICTTQKEGIITIGNYTPSNHNASRVVDNDGLAPTIMENHGTITATQTSDLRIRKLTPRECFRLMGVKDEDFDKVSKNQSDSSLYHLAGDSIVCQCLEAIFKEMIE